MQLEMRREDSKTFKPTKERIEPTWQERRRKKTAAKKRQRRRSAARDRSFELTAVAPAYTFAGLESSLIIRPATANGGTMDKSRCVSGIAGHAAGVGRLRRFGRRNRTDTSGEWVAVAVHVRPQQEGSQCLVAELRGGVKAFAARGPERRSRGSTRSSTTRSPAWGKKFRWQSTRSESRQTFRSSSRRSMAPEVGAACSKSTCSAAS